MIKVVVTILGRIGNDTRIGEHCGNFIAVREFGLSFADAAPEGGVAGGVAGSATVTCSSVIHKSGQNITREDPLSTIFHTHKMHLSEVQYGVLYLSDDIF